MENVAEALKLGFAVLVFMVALVLLFNVATTARTTAESVIQSMDRTTYHTYLQGDERLVDDNRKQNSNTRRNDTSTI